MFPSFLSNVERRQLPNQWSATDYAAGQPDQQPHGHVRDHERGEHGD